MPYVAYFIGICSIASLPPAKHIRGNVSSAMYKGAHGPLSLLSSRVACWGWLQPGGLKSCPYSLLLHADAAPVFRVARHDPPGLIRIRQTRRTRHFASPTRWSPTGASKFSVSNRVPARIVCSADFGTLPVSSGGERMPLLSHLANQRRLFLEHRWRLLKSSATSTMQQA